MKKSIVLSMFTLILAIGVVQTVAQDYIVQVDIIDLRGFLFCPGISISCIVKPNRHSGSCLGLAGSQQHGSMVLEIWQFPPGYRSHRRCRPPDKHSYVE